MLSKAQGERQKAGNQLVLSFLAVRRAIGALGYFLPVVLALYGVASGGILTSLSAYYYSPMREIFVGCLIAQAVFLWSYEGYRDTGTWLTDRLVARVASVAVALVALVPTGFPVTPNTGLPVAGLSITSPPMPRPPSCTFLQCVLGNSASALVHLIAAGVFFAALAVYCLVLFVRGSEDSAEKQASNRIYRICGWTIIASIGLIGLLFVTGLDQRLAALRPVFWLEFVACFAFATSWTVKGDALRPMVQMMARPRGLTRKP
ncbi:DUF998 domain-containing protein [Paracoccus shanxieyensis]|uniref:DUF998 domain-containing protein n=1 Tax=Paracoccus shanxieyensis TaxID=2675752 RepID=A0A6L6J5H0_9RHOB|nr:DUF998 domain-containing protein [Paracoccus shanxieyensis]MTH66602.1 DUF998 domain-containing protein [Paracoccus shanxieyensis]MTH89837.1 DUF998 domain-containing protein [Paracoccus shanxieyensis]